MKNETIIETLCPICGKTHFESYLAIGRDDSSYREGIVFCDHCGWFYDYDQLMDHDLEDGINEMSINQYKKWYQGKLEENPNYDFIEEKDKEFNKPHPCPVCGKYTFPSSHSYDICPYCGWEDDDYFEGGGANDLSLDEMKERYHEELQKDPHYRWIDFMHKGQERVMEPIDMKVPQTSYEWNYWHDSKRRNGLVGYEYAKGFRRETLLKYSKKHQCDAKKYRKLALKFANLIESANEVFIDPNGVVTYKFNKKTNEFVLVNRKGKIITYFIAKDGSEYYEEIKRGKFNISHPGKLIKHNHVHACRCPVCANTYFDKPSGEKHKLNDQLNYDCGLSYCFDCGWIYDGEQLKNPDKKNGLNVLSLNEYREQLKKILEKNPDYYWIDDHRYKRHPHKCPVCGKYEFEDDYSFELCPYCGWEDDNYFKDGGANGVSLEEAKIKYQERINENPDYKWEED